jgi:hypothetical protein
MGKKSMKYSILIPIILSLANYSIAQENPQKEIKTGVIKGVVHDSDTKTPLIGVRYPGRVICVGIQMYRL